MSQVRQSDPPMVSDVSHVIDELRSLAIRSLGRMYRPEKRLFAFRLRKDGDGDVREGVSRRYTATALIGLIGEDRGVVSEVLGGHCPMEVCGRLIEEITEMKELGEVALTAWAARVLDHPNASVAVETLQAMQPQPRRYPTVQVSWALTALSVNGSDATDTVLAKQIAEALMDYFRPESGLFPSGHAGKGLASLRASVSCFADIVYPIQALSHYHTATGDTRAAAVASRCADRMCELQGSDGQWWWHFDVRSGQVVERYPVYSVHQDSMAPMALFAVDHACGWDHSSSIRKGLHWLVDPAEKTPSLIDRERGIIWRKVARREPRKLTRSLQAVANCLHTKLRVPGVDTLFPPVSIDYESRPYHMGWILHAWPLGRGI